MMRMFYESDFPNRTLCDTLEAMRKAYETRNFSYLPGLIEEAQNYGNRMEAGLGDKHDVRSRTERLASLKKEIRELNKQKEKLSKKVSKLQEEKDKLEPINPLPTKEEEENDVGFLE